MQNTLGFALVLAAVITPAAASRMDAETAWSPLAVAIAVQGDQALREIRRDARVCLRDLKPAPLDALIQVRFDPPTEIVQNTL